MLSDYEKLLISRQATGAGWTADTPVLKTKSVWNPPNISNAKKTKVFPEVSVNWIRYNRIIELWEKNQLNRTHIGYFAPYVDDISKCVILKYEKGEYMKRRNITCIAYAIARLSESKYEDAIRKGKHHMRNMIVQTRPSITPTPAVHPVVISAKIQAIELMKKWRGM